jgi:predicted enzyme related to lactoylglutathione lyase
VSEVTEYKPNTFCWPELTTSDAAGAKKFYCDLFGLEFRDDEVGPGMVYTMFSKNGKSVGAMFELNEEMKQCGIPPNWLSYVSVTSVDDTLQKAKELGGTAFREATDVMDVGRLAVLQDPTGAVFALWQPKKHIGAELVNEPGTLCWNELMTTNVDQAGKFYTDLFNWGAETADMGGMNYTSFMNGDRPAGGMMAITKEMGEVPPHWMAYFAVEDCDKSAEKIKSLGGQILHGPQDIPEVGRFATAMDPQGVVFSIIKLNNPQ